MNFRILNNKQLIARFVPLILLIPTFLLTFLFIYARDFEAKSTIGTVTIEEYQKEINKEIIDKFDISHKLIYLSEGKASYYGRKFHNRKTASGEKFDKNALTAAHRKLPFGTIVRVTNPEKNKVILVRINDRGPFIKSRIIDLSQRSADDIEGIGLPFVKIEALKPNEQKLISYAGYEYLYGYSLDKPLICIPSNLLTILDSCSIFDDAYTIYNEISNYDKDVYLFASSKKPSKNKSLSEPQNYYIAKIRIETLPEKSLDLVQNH